MKNYKFLRTDSPTIRAPRTWQTTNLRTTEVGYRPVALIACRVGSLTFGGGEGRQRHGFLMGLGGKEQTALDTTESLPCPKVTSFAKGPSTHCVERSHPLQK